MYKVCTVKKGGKNERVIEWRMSPSALRVRKTRRVDQGFITIISRGSSDNESEVIVFCLYSGVLGERKERVGSFSIKARGCSWIWIIDAPISKDMLTPVTTKPSLSRAASMPPFV